MEDRGNLRFNELCKILKVSKYRIAKGTGVSENTLSYWSRGKTTPTIDILLKISKFLGVPVEFFYDETAIDVEKYGVFGKLSRHIEILLQRPDIADFVLELEDTKKEDITILRKTNKAYKMEAQYGSEHG